MKKEKLFFFCLVVAMTLLSCTNELDNFVSKKKEAEIGKELSEILPKQYADIGINHNDILYDFYFNNADRQILNTPISYKELSVEDYFGKFDKKYYFKDILSEYSRNVQDNVSVTESLAENELITKKGAEYISKIENILDEPLDSLEETQDAISKIEIEVLVDSENENLYDFFSYAETAKASLEFWNENIEILDSSEELNNNDRGIFKNLWNKYKHRLGMMAASDAAGAAAGAILGAALGAEILGPQGAAIGAIIGATAVGVPSSAEGFKKDAVCIVFSLDSLRKKIEQKS